MTLAAIYARFSSDSQRDESIEIQVERCAQLIERERWVQGEVYADHAMSGTSDDRPAFRRCVGDGVAGLFDVLVIYKHDRFARNVEVSRRYKRMLRDAGVRIVSVREGESSDTPDGFLHEGLDELFAEYYSRNLSVLIREGNRKSAEKRKACGHRVFGYSVDGDDRFVVDEAEAAVVRHLFEAYTAGDSVNDLAAWMRERGVKTKFGNDWRPTSIARLLKNDAYAGVYRFNGVVDEEDGMPAIIGRGLFEEVQGIMADRDRGRRRKDAADYLLTGKLLCLDDGRPMGGSSGTGASGAKYCYYRCAGCGARIPRDAIEDAVTGAVKEFLSDDASVMEMAAAVMDYAESLPDSTPMLVEERDAVLRRRDRLVSSIADGIPAKSVKGALEEAEERLEELDRLLARERFNKEHLLDEERVLAYVRAMADRIDRNPGRLSLVVDTFVDKVYADGECAVVLFDLGDTQEVFDLETLRSMKNGEQPGQGTVRHVLTWWSRGERRRTLYVVDGVPALVAAI